MQAVAAEFSGYAGPDFCGSVTIFLSAPSAHLKCLGPLQPSANIGLLRGGPSRTGGTRENTRGGL